MLKSRIPSNYKLKTFEFFFFFFFFFNPSLDVLGSFNDNNNY